MDHGVDDRDLVRFERPRSGACSLARWPGRTGRAATGKPGRYSAPRRARGADHANRGELVTARSCRRHRGASGIYHNTNIWRGWSARCPSFWNRPACAAAPPRAGGPS